MKTHVTEDELLSAVAWDEPVKAAALVTRLKAHFRAVDRAIQKARKAGHIQYDAKFGWSVGGWDRTLRRDAVRERVPRGRRPGEAVKP